MPIIATKGSHHLVIFAEGMKAWVLTMVYNLQSLFSEKILWKVLSGKSSLNLSWILTGNFNPTVSPKEHKGSFFRHYSSKCKMISDFVSQSNLLDLGFIGENFTWCNGLGLAEPIRLGRFLSNGAYVSNFKFDSNLHLARTNSGNAP